MAKTKTNKNPNERRDGHNWFLSAPAFGIPAESVDRDAGVIYGLAVCTEGEAKGHGVSLDAEFIAEVAKHGNRKKSGLKARFGHPAMSGTALGTFVGRTTNFRIDNSGKKSIVRADLQIAESAASSPNGNLKEYVAALADDDPGAFGVSIVFTPGQTYKRNEKGTKVYPPNGDDDRRSRERQRRAWNAAPEPIFASMEKLHAADLVDDPAANPGGLFNAFATGPTIAGQVCEFLDLHPHVFDAVADDPTIIDGFFARYRAYLERKGNGTMAKDTNDDQAFDDAQDNAQDDDAQADALIDGQDADPTAAGDDAQDGDDDAQDGDDDAQDGDDDAQDGDDDAQADDAAQADDDAQAGDDAQDDDDAQDGDDDAQDGGESMAAARDELKRFIAKFGAKKAATYFADGLAFNDALAKHADDLAEQLADVQTKYAAATADRGEETPVEFNANGDGMTDDQAAEFKRLKKSFKGDEKRARRAFNKRHGIATDDE